jgi:hypothetical protein
MGDNPRKRATRQDVVNVHQALDAVKQTNQRIGQWQITSARLSAIARRSSDPGTLSSCRERAEELRNSIAEELAAFSERSSSLSPQVFATGRLRDTTRALASVSSGVEATIRVLDGAAATPR